MPLFRDRREAGKALAERIAAEYGDSDAIVLALPRGGVPVGYEVANTLHAPLDVFLVRKLGMPGEEELALGAVASGGVRVLNREVVEHSHISNQLLDQITAREQHELENRERLYRQDRRARDVKDRVVIVVDDGLATGATMLAATRALRARDPRKIIVGVPVAARQTCDVLRTEVDEVVCAATPHPFNAVGIWYEDFSQTTDEEVRELLLGDSG